MRARTEPGLAESLLANRPTTNGRHGRVQRLYQGKGVLTQVDRPAPEASRTYQALRPRSPVVRCLWRQGPQSALQRRDLEPYEGRKANKRQLVRSLQVADDADNARNAMSATRELHRFSEFPPELRNLVYKFYCESLSKVPPRFVVLLLCRASRQLRSETTGLFFEHRTFIILLRPVHSP